MSRFLCLTNFPAKTCGSVTKTEQWLQRCYVYTHQMFDEISQRDLSSLNSQLLLRTRSRNFRAAWDLFCHMHSTRPVLSSYTFTSVLGACSALPAPERGKQVHALMIKWGTDSEPVPKTAVVDMYSKYGLLGDSVKAFNEIELKDVVTWNALLSSFVRHGMAKEAFGVFEAMRRARVEFSEFTLSSMLKACALSKAFPQGKQVHALVVVLGRDLVFLSTALIDFYSAVGFITGAMTVFNVLDGRVDPVMINSLVSACVRNKNYEEAFSVMSTMRPNAVALTSALAACSQNSDLWIGKQIHCVAVRFGLTCDTQLCNVMIDMYAKCGKILNARSLFDGNFQKDVVSWTSMIDAYGSHGYGIEALELFKEMCEEGRLVLPNHVTFLAVLSACAHSGLVEEARACFKSMREKYGLHPGQEHYACFIDTLGRAGQIEEVWGLFNDIVKEGSEPTTFVWAAILNACKLNLDVKRGELAAKQLLELEPDKPGNYVLLSNFYAAIGKWDCVDELRSTMRNKGLAKEIGSSWVTVAKLT